MQTNEENGIVYDPELTEKIHAQKYADIMLDWTFKYVFGPSGKYKEGLISLLNAILPEKKIQSIEYLPTEMLGEVKGQRSSVMDLRCKSEDGTQFVVEMQNYQEDGFFARCIAYASKLYLEQNKRGAKYRDFLPVYVVAILSGEATKEMELYAGCPDQVIYDHTMIEKISGIFAPRTISIIFADTGKFSKDLGECQDDMDRWLFLLKHSERMMEYSDSFQTEVFRRVLEVLEISSFTQEEYNMYYTEAEQKKIRQAQDETVMRIGREKGFAEGMEKGRAEGKAEGMAISISRLLDSGMSVDKVAELLKISEDECRRYTDLATRI